MSFAHPDNPLLQTQHLPAFDQIQAAHVTPAIRELIRLAKAALEEVTQPGFPCNWTRIASVLDVATERLSVAWGAVGHLNSVKDHPEFRAAYNEVLPEVSEFWTALGSDERLYALYRSLDPHELNVEQRRARELALLGFRLGGAELAGEKKLRFAQIQERMAYLTQKFSENVLDATDHFEWLVETEDLKGLPSDLLDATAAAAQAKGQSGHLLTLKMPIYLPVMQTVLNSKVREVLYRAYGTRASEQAEPPSPERDNSDIMREILSLRHEEAQLLGFEHYADVSLASKMAPSAKAVCDFLLELAQRAQPYAKADLKAMREFARDHMGIAEPEPWDWPLIGEKLKEHQFGFNDQTLRPYFQAPLVLKGLFKVAYRLFGIEFQEEATHPWAEGVQLFSVQRVCQNGQRMGIGHFFLDSQARSGKRGGAWMDDVRGRWNRPDRGQTQQPVAHMVCNFAASREGQVALLTHDDVTTLFHEFGHALHHLLTEVNERDVSGIHGVEWDAVELPSQFMENFCWEWEVLQELTCHVETGETLPRDLYEQMLKAKNYQSGLATLRQVEFALFDMKLHMQTGQVHVMQTLNEVRQEVAVLTPPDWHRSPHTFSHIFAGGYSAGYYSYKWAEVLSADAYAAFEEAAQQNGSVLDAHTGELLIREVLSKGGSRPAMESFKAFRGREPQIDALLRHQGMNESTALTM
jgi:oligopeptidase A